MKQKDPQNPYESFIIEASAGSGKTYQLSKRFLFLVGAGTEPSSILTITFTVKAASEMRARIIDEALCLMYEKKAREDFTEKLKFFYEQKRMECESRFFSGKVRTALETAQSILSSTQTLKICTIDSVFYQWSLKFPWEAKLPCVEFSKLKVVTDLGS